MAELGGTRLFGLGSGDDDENIENDFLVWKKAFSAVVCQGTWHSGVCGCSMEHFNGD
jgi:hypothetical protein